MCYDIVGVFTLKKVRCIERERGSDSGARLMLRHISSRSSTVRPVSIPASFLQDVCLDTRIENSKLFIVSQVP
jgi:hypothetical protein